MRVPIITIVFALLIPLRTQAQQNEVSQADARQDQPEEVLITGKRLMLRTQMMDAEQEAYNIFNKYNDEKRFHINCDMQQPTGTHLAVQLCLPEFVNEATSAHGQGYLESYRLFLDPYSTDKNSPVLHQPVAAKIARQQPEYRRKMKQLAQEHPDFLEAIIRYSELKERYEQPTTTVNE